MLFTRRLLCLLVVALSCFLPLHAQTTFSTVVVFGDSLSDTGNFAHITQSTYQIRFPGDSQLLGINYTDGRFTDGAETQPAAKAYLGVWVEQVAASFAAKPAIKASLDGGTNYAYGEASTQDGTSTISASFAGLPISVSVHNMGQQVTDYIATVPTPNAQTLYILWGGANDLYTDPTQASATATAQRELALVQRLIAIGATNFMIPNLPPLGGIPAHATDPATVTALNTVSGQFAAALTQGIASLKLSAAAQGHTINVYQPDIFSAFAAAAQNPMAIGLGNVSVAAQGVSGSPDTYLIWDGLHPTTTGHHYVAAAAANLLTPLVASSTKLTAPSAVLTGQTVTLSAVVSSTASAPKPTGLVTFFNAGAVIGSGALDATGTTTATFSPVVASSPYNITAVYAGDTTFSPSSSTAQSLGVITTPVTTSTTVASSSLTANLGASVTFTATVAPSVGTYGNPTTGNMTFLDGTTTIGTGAVSNGAATFTSSTLTAGTHTITARYAASGVFGASTSAAISQVITAPNYAATASPTSITIARGGSGTTTVTVTPTGGYTGTATLACGNLPAHLSCSFSSATLTLGSNAPQTSTLTIATNATAAMEMPARPGASNAARIFSAMLLGPGLGGLFLACIRRRKAGYRSPRLLLLMLLLSAGTMLGVTGCGGASNNAPAGTYTVPVTVTPASGAATTVSLQVIVQ